MDTAIYQDTGGRKRFSKFAKSNSEDNVPIERLVTSMESHLMNGKAASITTDTTVTSTLPTANRKQISQSATGRDNPAKDEQLASQLDRSFCLNLDHQTLTTLMNSEDKTIEFEIPASNHPRLDTPFYNALRKKYPKAFIRRASVSSLFSEADTDVVGSARRPKSKPGLPPKPRKLLDQSISGSLKRLQSHSPHGSTVSLNMDMPSSLAFKRTDSMLSLKERLQQNQDQWKKVMTPGLSPFHRQKFHQSRGMHSRSASVPNAMSVDIVPADAPVLVPKEEEDIHFEAKGQKHVYQSRNRRFASPDSSHDSAVDMDSASLQSSPTSDKQDEANRLSRQQNRSVMPAKDRPPRSRTPKLKSARGKLPNASGASSMRSISVPESDGDSGIAAAHWANPLSVDTLTINDRHSAMEDHILIIKNDISAISPEGAPRVRSSLELLENSEDLRSSREKVKFADDQIDPLNSSERYITDDDSSSSQGTCVQGARMSTFKPNGPIETLTASTRRKNAKAKPVLAPKPPLPKPSLSRQDNTSEVAFYSANIDGGRKAKKEKKKSLLPWKRSKGKYTPSKEEHLASPMMTPLASPVSIRSFATVNARPKRPSSVIESVSMDEGSSQGNMEDESFDDTEYDDDDSLDHVDYSSKPPKMPSSCAANDSQEITVEPSNLQKSKELSGSRTSLKEQFGNWRDNAKQKMGRLRRAISMEKVDKENEEKDKAKKTSGKMKKSPSLQSLTKVFKGKRGSKDKINDSKKPPSGSSQSSFRASKRSLTKQDIVSDPNQTPQNVRSIGKLMHVNEDGTKIIELARPKDGPMGFYVAKGNAEYKHGFFVSRLSDALPEHFFAGIMTVGDEILEINGRKVIDMPLDGVYDLLGHGNTVVLRTLPYAAREGSNLI